LKKCSKCQIEKELNEFSKDRHKKDGLRTVCRPCTKITQDIWYAKEYAWFHEQQAEKLASDHKTCSKCGESKLKSEYHKDKQALDKLRYNCKECDKKTKKMSTRDIKSYNKQWSRDNKIKVQGYVEKYNKENPDQVTYRAALRRASKRQATPPWVDKEHKTKIKEIYKSARVSSEFHEMPFHVDHIHPLKGVNEQGEHVSCGLHVWWNLRGIPAKENLEKYNKMIVDEIK
jgi:ribosomal protein S27AE